MQQCLCMAVLTVGATSRTLCKLSIKFNTIDQRANIIMMYIALHYTPAPLATMPGKLSPAVSVELSSAMRVELPSAVHVEEGNNQANTKPAIVQLCKLYFCGHFGDHSRSKTLVT